MLIDLFVETTIYLKDKLYEMGLDFSLQLTDVETHFLNHHVKNDTAPFDFANKKNAFLEHIGGSNLINKQTYFNYT
jgi:hypothetical protein